MFFRLLEPVACSSLSVLSVLLLAGGLVLLRIALLQEPFLGVRDGVSELPEPLDNLHLPQHRFSSIDKSLPEKLSNELYASILHELMLTESKTSLARYS